MPVGSFAWRRTFDVAARVEQELDELGASWPPLQLFDVDLAAFRELKTRADEHVKIVKSELRIR